MRQVIYFPVGAGYTAKRISIIDADDEAEAQFILEQLHKRRTVIFHDLEQAYKRKKLSPPKLDFNPKQRLRVCNYNQLPEHDRYDVLMACRDTSKGLRGIDPVLVLASYIVREALNIRNAYRLSRNPDGSGQAVGERKRGRKPITGAKAERRREIYDDWQRAKKYGLPMKAFCFDHDISLDDMTKIVDWIRTQRRRKQSD